MGKSNLNNASHCIFMSFDAISGIVGFCGIICSDCPVFKATRKNDDAERRRVSELFTRQYGQEYESKDMNCDGCVVDGKRIFSYCSACEVRQCGRKRRIKNCAYCATYPCKKLDEIFKAYPKAKQTLEGMCLPFSRRG
jgi:hypothetical protein